jgi:hypothetical protein
LKRTFERRPDLLEKTELCSADQQYLKKIKREDI